MFDGDHYMSSSTEVPPRSRRSSTYGSIRSTHSRKPTWRSPSFIKTTGATAAAAAGVSIVFAEPEQGAPLAKASASIPASSSPLSVEVRREDEGGEQTRETWHWLRL